MDLVSEEEVVQRRPRVWIRRVLPALLAVALVLGSAGIAQAVTRGVKAVRTDNGWRWRDMNSGALKHTYLPNPGDYVRWRNPTSRTHNVVAYGGNWTYSRSLSPGGTFRRQFNSTGNFRYRCTLHSSLAGGVCSGQCGIIHV